ncbi:hypothetical protein GGX14DRAFT_571548 [Mycena pura]|uniref:Uncharacterized protein n=1 Tax=Mycena pura TaxID=153505 RepID=A0AAD6V5L4_9AGAR|nr:hypothetical protein GGX14DRAFT_571548 [Mycena pura]
MSSYCVQYVATCSTRILARAFVYIAAWESARCLSSLPITYTPTASPLRYGHYAACCRRYEGAPDSLFASSLSAQWAAYTRPTLRCPAQGHLFPLAEVDPRWWRWGMSVLCRRRALRVRASRGDSAACSHVGALSRRRAMPRGICVHLKLTLENAAKCYQLDTLARGDDHAYTARCCGWLRTSCTLAYWRPRGAATRRTRCGGRSLSCYIFDIRAMLASMRDQTPMLVMLAWPEPPLLEAMLASTESAPLWH